MKIECRYDIKNFTYKRSENTLYGEEKDLYFNTGEAIFTFPNGRKQFFVYNLITGNFRRFRLFKEDELQYTFTSEDGIYCVVAKDLTEKRINS